MPLYQIGRSGRCDIVLDDHAVSKRHAELLTLDDGRLYLSDCASRNGTHVLRDGRWRAIRQTFVRRDERVRFGTLELTAAALLGKFRIENQRRVRAGPRALTSVPTTSARKTRRRIHCRKGRSNGTRKPAKSCRLNHRQPMRINTSSHAATARMAVAFGALLCACVFVFAAGHVLSGGLAKALLDFPPGNTLLPYPVTIQNIMWVMFFFGCGELLVRHMQGMNEGRQLSKRLLPEDDPPCCATWCG